MVFFNVCDTLAFHPKALVAGNAALGLWVRAGSWSQDVLTDGHIPLGIATSIGASADVKRLVVAGLWVPTATGYEIHDFLDYNRSKVKVRADKAAGKERQRKWRETRDKDRANDGQMFNETHDETEE